MAMALGNSLVKLERVTEFLPSRHVLWVVKDNLCLEHSHADGHEEKLLAHAEQRGLLHGSALQYTFTDGMEQDVRCGIEEDSQAVSLEGVARESVAVDSLLELAYVQLVATALAVPIFIERLGIKPAAHVSDDEPDVQFTLLRDLCLDGNKLIIGPGVGPIHQTTISLYGLLRLFVILFHLLAQINDDRVSVEDVVAGQPGDVVQPVLFGRHHPVHKLMRAEVAVAADDNLRLGPGLTQAGNEPFERVTDVGRLVAAPRLEQRENHLATEALEDEQRHVAITVVVAVEQRELLHAVCVDVCVIAVQDDLLRRLAIIGKDEHRDKHLLNGQQILLAHHVLEAAHRRRGAQVLVQLAGVDRQLHHRVLTHAVAVVDILVAEAYLEYTRHNDFLQRVVNEQRIALVRDAGGQLGCQRQVLFLALENGQATERGEARLTDVCLYGKIINSWEANFCLICLVGINKMLNFAHMRSFCNWTLQI